LLLECGSDRGGFRFGNDEHLRSMVKWVGTSKRLVGRSAFRPGSFLVVLRIDLRLIVAWLAGRPAEHLRRWPPIWVIDLRVMARRPVGGQSKHRQKPHLSPAVGPDAAGRNPQRRRLPTRTRSPRDKDLRRQRRSAPSDAAQ
jgi:hypothetical protein